MKIAVAGDHAGLGLKKFLIADLVREGHEVLDLGAYEYDADDDYPDFAERVALALTERKAERGLLICGSGVGVSVAVNKFPGMRAATLGDTYSARQGVEHDDINVLCLGERVIGQALARDVVRSFVEARFSGEERHVRRLEKILRIERRYLRPPDDGRT